MKYQIGQKIYKLHEKLRTTNPTNCEIMFNDYQKTICYVVFKIIEIGQQKDPHYLLIKDEYFAIVKKHFEDNWNLYEKEYDNYFQFMSDFMFHFYGMTDKDKDDDNSDYWQKIKTIKLEAVRFFDHNSDSQYWAENYEEYWKKTEESFDINKSQLAREIELTKKKLAKLEEYKEKFDVLEVK